MIVGTAGHVDHGKTSLVRALTGIDTSGSPNGVAPRGGFDRLPEEKKRGITLELGFAHWELPSKRVVGVVDVPGHERFIKAMAAGAGGVDVAMLVVAADEGVMPQTREHLDICTLLGVRAGVLVVSKTDLLPELGDGWLELLEADLRNLVEGTPFEGAPLVAVSSKSGAGLVELARAVDAQCAALEKTPLSGRGPDAPVLLPIDRAFTVKGFGVVVTGTLWSGRLAPGEELSLLPAQKPCRVRGVQVHGKAVEFALAGTRVAVNVPDLSLEDVSRGHALVRAGELGPVMTAEVALSVLPAETLGKRARLRATVGTAQVDCVVKLVSDGAVTSDGTPDPLPQERGRGSSPSRSSGVADGTSPHPRPQGREKGSARGVTSSPSLSGFPHPDPLAQSHAAGRDPSRSFARLTFLEPIAALPGQRFILRSTRAGAATVAGGTILVINPPRRRKDTRQRLTQFAAAPLDERLRLLLVDAGYAGLDEKALAARAQASAKEVARAIDVASAKGAIVVVGRASLTAGPEAEGKVRRLIAGEVLTSLVARTFVRLDALLSADASRAGVPREELRQRLGEPPDKVLQRALDQLVASKKIELQGELVCIPGRGRAFTEAVAARQAQLLDALEKRQLSPPTLYELSSTMRCSESELIAIGQALVAAGSAVRAGELFFAKSAIDALQLRIVEWFSTHEKLATQDFKELTGLSRKFLIPLAEYFDRERLTLRVGDERVLRKR
ncbi:MAG: selenocysteine-specific translation elongation factor [Archangium sp.]|nr:selenocysteine-specific translation elongation factor [Archangium sp.]